MLVKALVRRMATVVQKDKIQFIPEIDLHLVDDL
jgi:hypothetical protein